MAKAVAKTGRLSLTSANEKTTTTETLGIIYTFIKHYRENSKKLSSLIIELDYKGLESFSSTENCFWNFIKKLSDADKAHFEHDPRVSNDSWSNYYSYSLMEEAFFLLLLHPKSPRLARRYYKAAIVFNLHDQFEALRKNEKFFRIRDLIRNRDQLLQGEDNPMLDDYGKGSEVYQYTGRHYHDGEDPRSFLKGDEYEYFRTKKWNSVRAAKRKKT